MKKNLKLILIPLLLILQLLMPQSLFVLRVSASELTPMQRLSDFVFSDSLQTDALLISKNGKIIFEKYARGYDETRKHPVWSVSKSISALIFGIAEGEKRISRQDLISKYIPLVGRKPIVETEWANIRMEHLLTMTTGLHWQESYEESPLKSHVVASLYRLPFITNQGEYRLQQQKRVASPGERFEYSTGDINLLMMILKKALGPDYHEYPWKKLFEPAGMKHVTFEQDVSGTFLGGSYVYTTGKSLLRLGELVLGNGRLNAKQIVPPEYIKTSIKPHGAFKTLRLDHDPEQAYGYGWWINEAPPESQLGVKIKAPRDMIWAQGHYGQFIFIIPSQKTVVVRLATDLKRRMDKEKFFELLQGVL